MTLIPVGADIGNSNSNIAVWGRDKEGNRTIKCFKLPSHVNNQAPSLVMDGLSNSVSSYTFEHEETGEVFTVMPGCDHAINLFNKGQTSKEIAALTNAALLHAGLGGKEVALATNLPLIHEQGFGYFAYDPTVGRYIPNKKLISGKCKSLISTKFKSLNPGVEMPIIRHAAAFAELYAGALSTQCDLFGNITQDNKKRGYIDLGGGTSQLGIMTNLDIDSTTAKTLPIGALSINDELYKILAKNLDGFIEHCDKEKIRAQLSTIIETRSLTYMRKEVKEIGSYIDQAAEKAAPKTIEPLIHILKNNMYDLDEICTLGGAVIPFNKCLNSIDDLVTLQNPAYRNAIGLLLIMTFMSPLSSKIDVDEVISMSDDLVEKMSDVCEEVEVV